MKLKYATKISDRLYPKGHPVAIASLATARKQFPTLQNNPGPNIVAVVFDEKVDQVTFMSLNQVEL